MKIIVRVLALLFATLDACALADDAVGVMRVDVGTNALVGATMPFAPLSDSGPLGYVSGPVAGDGGESSDRISVSGTKKENSIRCACSSNLT